MRTFDDQSGTTWTADVHREEGPDYKGRFFFVVTNDDGAAYALKDVRWNSERTAKRTLETMAQSELARRFRSARARGTAPLAG